MSTHPYRGCPCMQWVFFRHETIFFFGFSPCQETMSRIHWHFLPHYLKHTLTSARTRTHACPKRSASRSRGTFAGRMSRADLSTWNICRRENKSCHAMRTRAQNFGVHECSHPPRGATFDDHGTQKLRRSECIDGIPHALERDLRGNSTDKRTWDN
jgi:hypothetical protein